MSAWNKLNNMFSIMANSGFGGATVYRPDGVIIMIPKCQINQTNGKIKLAVRRLTTELTRENIVKLEKMGVRMDIQMAG